MHAFHFPQIFLSFTSISSFSPNTIPPLIFAPHSRNSPPESQSPLNYAWSPIELRILCGVEVFDLGFEDEHSVIPLITNEFSGSWSWSGSWASEGPWAAGCDSGGGVRDFSDQHGRFHVPAPCQRPRDPQGHAGAPRKAVSFILNSSFCQWLLVFTYQGLWFCFWIVGLFILASPFELNREVFVRCYRAPLCYNVWC